MYRFLLFIGCLTSTFFYPVYCKEPKPPPNIAVIGAGIGGASVSYFLSQEIPGSQITVFEKGEIGGRLAVEEIGGRKYEYGGSIIHAANKYMVDYLNICGLKKKETPQDNPFSLYKENNIIFQQWGYSLLDTLRTVWRYGPFSLLKLQYFVKNLLSNFGNIYSKLNGGKGYATVIDLLNDMSPVSKKGEPSSEMVDLTKITLKKKLESLNIGEQLIEELVTVATRVNYGQMPGNVHAFVGSVGLAGMDGDLWAVEGGNVKVVECALDKSRAKVVRGIVNEVTGSAGNFLVSYSTSTSQNATRSFDLVVIASPLTADKSKISGLPLSSNFPGAYHTTVATLVQGELSLQYSTLTNFFLSEENYLVSLAKLSPVDFDPSSGMPILPVYKIFSTRPLSDRELSLIFKSVETVNVTSWLAYPSYKTVDLTSFELSPGLYYTSRIEWAASAMEMSVISAKNIANLLSNFWNDDSRLHSSVAGSRAEKQKLEL